MTGVTKNSRLFAVTSTTCSTLLQQLVVTTAVFAPPIDIQQALVQHTQSVSVPIRRPSDRSSVSHKLRDKHIYTSSTSQIHQDTRYIYAVYSCVWILMRVASVGCFPGAWRRGPWHFQVASLHLQSSMDLLFVRFTLFLLPEQA